MSEDKAPKLEEKEEKQLSASQLSDIQALLAGGAPVTPTVELVEWAAVEGEPSNREMYCPRCTSKIALADTASLVSHEMQLSRYKVAGPELQLVDKFWLLPSLMHFENIGVTRLVDNIKFLSCADCEVGPLGWHDVTDLSKFYLAAERVRYRAH